VGFFEEKGMVGEGGQQKVKNFKNRVRGGGVKKRMNN